MMGRSSNLFTVGIFIIFFAILFHYFCKTRKKREQVIVQQQIVPADGYVYPITANNLGQQQQQVVVGPNTQLYPAMPMPYPTANTGSSLSNGQYIYPYPYTLPNNVNSGSAGTTVGTHGAFGANSQFPTTNHSQFAHPNPPIEELPPPYHVAVGVQPVTHHHPQ